MTLSFRRIHPDAVMPAYAHASDAGMDVRSVRELVIPPGGRALVPTGLVFNLPAGYEAQVRPRSGLALKAGVTVLNSPGTIDAGYRGEIGVILANFGQDDFKVNVGDRIAQLVIMGVESPAFELVEVLDDTERGEGGYGHTGVK